MQPERRERRYDAAPGALTDIPNDPSAQRSTRLNRARGHRRPQVLWGQLTRETAELARDTLKIFSVIRPVPLAQEVHDEGQ